MLSQVSVRTITSASVDCAQIQTISILEIKLWTFKWIKSSPHLDLKSAGVSKLDAESETGPGLGWMFPEIKGNKTVKHLCLNYLIL